MGDEKSSTNRRRFLNIILGSGLLGWLGSTFYPVISYLIPPKNPEAKVNTIKAGTIFDFPINSGTILKFGRKPVILIRTSSGDFRAFAATCTHLDCIVQYRTDNKQIWCACHNGIYDLKGRNVSGPPPKPLEEFSVNFVNDEIVVSKQEVG
ncbi:MAG: ubiquinol-cytochrome c reductase iron-sulfur subunit [Calditrichia bacterium]|nr:ubiquinol-cytochrome c reductase iron-sulfur subunit [Calditrichia bacterium]